MSQIKETCNREIVLHNVTHYCQKLSWDCGIACVMMMLSDQQQQHLANNFQAICEEEGFGQTTWSIDLCYLLRRFGMSPHLYTSTIGVKGYHLKKKYTEAMFLKMCDRVQRRFRQASAYGIQCKEQKVSCEELATKIQTGPAIVLVDAALLHCDRCKFNKLGSQMRSVWRGPYRGHFVLVVGADAGGSRVLYRNPAVSARECVTSFRALDRARAAAATDWDLIVLEPLPPQLDEMTNRTVLNDVYKGLVEVMSIPAEVVDVGDRKVAQCGSVRAIHTCQPDEVASRAASTHHYCDVFSPELLAPLEELVYVRLDDTTAEKVFINRHKRMLLHSSDGQLAQWRCAPTFESANRFMAGTPIVNKEGALVSVVTARRGNHYAVSSFEGEGGYMETSVAWSELSPPEGALVYGSRAFGSRSEMTAYTGGLPPAPAGLPPTPVLVRGEAPRVVGVAANGRQIMHVYLQGVMATDIEYL